MMYVKVPISRPLTTEQLRDIQDRITNAAKSDKMFMLVTLPKSVTEEQFEAIQQAVVGVVGELT